MPVPEWVGRLPRVTGAHWVVVDLADRSLDVLLPRLERLLCWSDALPEAVHRAHLFNNHDSRASNSEHGHGI